MNSSFIDSAWRPILRHRRIPRQWQEWLNTPHSLTERLREYFGPINVHVLQDRLGSPLPDERLGPLKGHSAYRLREVLLCAEGKPLVFAHSIIPLTPTIKRQQALARLGNQPLGHWLFQQREVKRQAIHVKLLYPTQPLFKRIPNAPQKPLHARRSWFQLGQEGLLVTEVFLVDMPDIKA